MFIYIYFFDIHLQVMPYLLLVLLGQLLLLLLEVLQQDFLL